MGAVVSGHTDGSWVWGGGLSFKMVHNEEAQEHGSPALLEALKHKRKQIVVVVPRF